MARGSVKTTAIKFKKGGWGTRTPYAPNTIDLWTSTPSRGGRGLVIITRKRLRQPPLESPWPQQPSPIRYSITERRSERTHECLYFGVLYVVSTGVQ